MPKDQPFYLVWNPQTGHTAHYSEGGYASGNAGYPFDIIGYDAALGPRNGEFYAYVYEQSRGGLEYKASMTKPTCENVLWCKKLEWNELEWKKTT